MKNKKVVISFALNILIVLMVIFACIVMFTGIKFMHGPEIALEISRAEMFKFFTVDSNILMGIAALLFVIQQYKVIKKKQKSINKIYYALYLMGTSAVSLTFFVVFAYLGNISEYGLKALLMNSNLFLHLIIPVASIISFILFLRTDKLPFKYTLWGIIPTFIYGIWYLSNVLTHMENGKVSPKYDFYWFVQQGVKSAIIVVPIIFIISYLISLVLWRFNKSFKSNKGA